MNNLEIKELNSKLEAKKIDDLFFIAKSVKNALCSCTGFGFYVDGKGFVTFKDKETPYALLRKKYVKEFINNGGFNDYSNITFIQPVEFNEYFERKNKECI